MYRDTSIRCWPSTLCWELLESVAAATTALNDKQHAVDDITEPQRYRCVIRARSVLFAFSSTDAVNIGIEERSMATSRTRMRWPLSAMRRRRCSTLKMWAALRRTFLALTAFEHCFENVTARVHSGAAVGHFDSDCGQRQCSGSRRAAVFAHLSRSEVLQKRRLARAHRRKCRARTPRSRVLHQNLRRAQKRSARRCAEHS